MFLTERKHLLSVGILLRITVFEQFGTLDTESSIIIFSNAFDTYYVEKLVVNMLYR